MIPTRIFTANEGDYSTELAGPDALEQDLDNITRMFNPLSTHKDGSPGGIGKENLKQEILSLLRPRHMPNLVYNSSFSRFDENLKPDYWDTDGIVTSAYSAFGDYSLYLTRGQHCYQQAKSGVELCDGSKYPTLQTRYGFRFLGTGKIKVKVCVDGKPIHISDCTADELEVYIPSDVPIEDAEKQVIGAIYNVNDIYWKNALDYVIVPPNNSVMKLCFEVIQGAIYIDGVTASPNSENVNNLIYQDGRKNNKDLSFITSNGDTDVPVGTIWFRR